MSTSPVWNAATVSAIVAAFITLLVAFGVPLTEQQNTAIMGFIAVIAPIAVAIVASPKVTSLENPTAKDGEPLVRESGSTRSAAVKR